MDESGPPQIIPEPPTEPEPRPGGDAPPAAETVHGDGTPLWLKWVGAAAFAGVAFFAGMFIVNRSNGSSASTTQTQANTNASGRGATGQNSAGGNAARLRGRGTTGTITAIDGTTVTVDATSSDGSTSTVKVETSSDTTYSERVTGSLSDLKAGDTITVAGTTSGSTVVATQISQVDGAQFANRPGAPSGNAPQPPADASGGAGPRGGFRQRNGNFTAGTISGVDGTTLTVTSVDGTTLTVTTDASTTVSVTRAIAFSDLKVGDTIRANGTSTTGTVAATAIVRGDLQDGFGGPGGGFGPSGRGGNGNDTSSSTSTS